VGVGVCGNIIEVARVVATNLSESGWWRLTLAALLRKPGLILMTYKLPLLLESQREGGYTVTSPLLPELLTEGNSFDEAITNARDAFAAVLEIYQDLGKPLPAELTVRESAESVQVDLIIAGS